MITLIKTYVVLNALIACISILLALLIRSRRHMRKHMAFSDLLKVSYTILLVSFVLSLMPLSSMSAPIWVPKAQVWSALDRKTLSATILNPKLSSVAITWGESNFLFPQDLLVATVSTLFFVGLLFVGIRIVRDRYKLLRILSDAYVIKKIGRVKILSSDLPITPFSAWTPQNSIVVVTNTLLAHPAKYRIVISHELQHHRQGDTRWIYLLHCLQALCFWNPWVHVLQKQIALIQEVACDEVVIGHHQVSSSAYCECLLWVAQNTLQNRVHLVGTARFTSSSAAKILRWRIEEMLRIRSQFLPRWGVAGVSVLMTCFLAAVAWAGSASIQDRRITAKDADIMAKHAVSEDFPIAVNDLVLAELNRYLGTPDGRRFMRESIERMASYESEVTDALKRYHLPEELRAVPLIESGYRNLPPNDRPGYGAGIWMFLARTARHFGLRVDSTIDERLNVPKETDAAMRALSGLYLQFQDWNLALMGYNMGAEAVNRAIAEENSRDAWHLIREGHQNDPRYLAQVIAAVLILKNPDYLR